MRTVPWAVRLALVGLFVLALLLVWTTNQVLTQRFSESSRSEADLQLALFSGNLNSELERQQVVPLLLARDPALTGALSSGDFSQSTGRLIEYSEEIGAAALTLLDASGRVVASTVRVNIGENQRDAAFYVEAMRSNDTVYSAIQDDVGHQRFYYSRRVDQGSDPIGVIVVEVDLKKFLSRWARLADAVVLLDSTGQVILATEPRWIGMTEQGLTEAIDTDGALISEPGSFLLTSGDAYLSWSATMRQETRVNFQGWRLVSYLTYNEVRERVNAVLAVEVMGFAILLALMFFALSRQADLRSRRLARESDRLRRLNQRLQAEIAERERAERNLQVAELSLAQTSKLAALGEMSAAVSHELNQPLAAMKTYLAGARLLIQRSRNDEALASFLRIDGLIDRMGSITRQLKAHARKETNNLVEVDLRSCVTSALDMMAPQFGRAGARVRSTLPDHPVIVLADQVRIEQVIVNLVRNGLDATTDCADPQIDIVLSSGDMATISVRDNGHGIDDLQNLFEPFYTTKAPGEGVGLGLAISSTIVKSMDGRLTARNGSDGGAIFKIDLPLAVTDEQGATTTDPEQGTAAE